jgi:uncharacterized membrane protein
MLQEITGCTASNPPQLAVKPLEVPQVAVAFIPLYVPVAGLLQSGAFADQAISVAVFPLLQVKTGCVISKPENPFAGTEPQASVAGLTFNVPLQLAVLVTEPQAAVTLIPLYMPVAGLLQSGAFADQVTSVAVFPLLQVKAGWVIATSEIPLAGTEPQVSVAGLTFNVPQKTVGVVPCPQSASANTA